MPFSHELQELYDTIMTLILEEWKVISAVFKEAVTVMEQFLRRVYALMVVQLLCHSHCADLLEDSNEHRQDHAIVYTTRIFPDVSPHS